MLNFLPENKSRIVVAMSGGVDSAVSAAYLKELGHEVIGISLELHDPNENLENKYGSCCSLTDLSDARRVAERIGIPFYVNNMENVFEETVIEDFISEYLKGRTPNPCVRCNEKVKFSRLMDWAMDLGADFLATGHYAQIQKIDDTAFLHKGVDPEKDQAYFLFTMNGEDLKKTVFPIGHLNKPFVRELAKKYGLNVASKPDSQEICFVQGQSYKEFIEKEAPKELLKSGPILTPEGIQLGEHTGLYQFTIGQRKGLGVYHKEPLFVLELKPESNTLIVGPEHFLFRKKTIAKDFRWIHSPPNSHSIFQAKIRYRSPQTPVLVEWKNANEVQINFEIPQRAITPGQAVVLYEGSKVIGGGWIDSFL